MSEKKSKEAFLNEHLKETKKQVEQVKEISKLQEDLQHKLIENLISLQKVHTDLAEKFNNLSDQIANLLGLFEMAARSFARNPVNQATEKDKEFLEKIDKMLDQNKVLAKGLMMMEERMRERLYGSPRPQPSFTNQSPPEEPLETSAISKPLPRV
ncbi:MAG: hypothetical protein AABY00_01480 [Nanoarchaeota archaeon]